MLKFIFSVVILHCVFINIVSGQSAQCNGTFGTPIVNITFGQGNSSQSSYSPLSAYAPGLVNFTTFQGNGSLAGQNVSALVKNASVFGPQPNWLQTTDHTGDLNGLLLGLNMPSQMGAKIFEVPLTNLCPNTTLRFSIWLINLMAPIHPMVLSGSTNIEYPNMVLRIVDGSNNVLANYTTGNIPTDGQWHEHFVLFNNGNNASLTLEIINNCSGTNYGNDVAMDDITVRPCVPSSNILPLLDTTLCHSTSMNFQANITPGVYSTPFFQWQVSTNSGASWSNIGAPSSSNNLTFDFAAGVGLVEYWLRYLVTPTNSGSNQFCSGISDTTIVKIDSISPILFPFNDSMICVSEPITLSSNVTGAEYLWSTGDISPQIEVNASGTYWLKVTNTSGCSATDTITISIKDVGEINLGNDTTLCEGAVLYLNAEMAGAIGYDWNTGAATPQITVNNSGIYWVRVNMDGCWISDTILVEFAKYPEFSLGNQIEICENGIVTLSPIPSYDLPYLWSNGSIEKTLKVDSPGTYWLSITNPPNCTYTDTVVVRRIDCVCTAILPNAFSPNNDNLNDKFIPVINQSCPLGVYDLMIYNRWGQQVFYTNQPHQGWDGTYEGKTADLGVYFYYLRYINLVTKNRLEYKGEVHLLR